MRRALLAATLALAWATACSSTGPSLGDLLTDVPVAEVPAEVLQPDQAPLDTAVDTPADIPQPDQAPVDTPADTPQPDQAPVDTPADTPQPDQAPVDTPTDIPQPDQAPVDTPADTPQPDQAPVDTPADIPQQDQAPVDTPADIPQPDQTPVDTPADTPQPDQAPVDTPVDLAADVPLPDLPPADTPVDTPTDACAPVLCDLFCPFGFRTDAAGCETCTCRDCATDKDCTEPALPCDTPVCGAAGVCLCDCKGQAPKEYDCPDGTSVPWCACGPLGWDCIDRPEDRCATLCRPGEPDSWTCPDGAPVPWCDCARVDCAPECRHIGSRSEGWYDSCSGDLVKYDTCAGCHIACQNIGTRSESWASSCNGFIAWAQCGTRRSCVETPESACSTTRCTVSTPPSQFPCPDGSSVPFCQCDVPAASCPPECRHVGSKSEGWYDSCSGDLVKYDTCKDCTAVCSSIGNKAEGWYSCNGLIAWAQCGTGTWSCEPSPWQSCEGRASSCVGEGGPAVMSGPSSCCPGLATIEAAQWDGSQCLYPNCACTVCTYCGDGRCVPPENRCNCPKDCLPGTAPGPLGSLCTVSSDCAKDLGCVLPAGGALPGVCSSICNPLAMGPAAQCAPGFACVSLPDHQAPGFCLQSCSLDPDCPYPMTCGTAPGMPDPTRACFPWSAYPG